MRTRRPLAYALAWAALKDAVVLVSTAAQYVVRDPLLCRLRGHHWHVWVSEQPYLVCDTCGRIERAQ